MCYHMQTRIPHVGLSGNESTEKGSKGERMQTGSRPNAKMTVKPGIMHREMQVLVHPMVIRREWPLLVLTMSVSTVNVFLGRTTMYHRQVSKSK